MQAGKSLEPFLHSIYAGGPKTLCDERGDWVSSIARERVTGPIQLSVPGLEGDKVNQPYHGGPEAAVCVHLAMHYQFWRDQYGIELNPGHLGENFLLEEIDESDVHAGDIVQVGSARVQVSGPRVPCENQARRAGRADWVKLTIRENRTGFYLRVLEPGVVQGGDKWVLQERLNERGAIPDLNRCLYLEFSRDQAEEFVGMPGLAEWWKQQFRERLNRVPGHWSEEVLKE